ncbi:hypothetical protein [Streptosporangium amethystogenes]|uniref:hypothetical protein n=1 Tax=Streptosporangium amethystogenes TaxID=2002 RepID=UPI0004C9E91C|nr:hypothetical protein [Streptosporangium amethystogenes]
MTGATVPHESAQGKSGPGEAAPDGSPGGKSEVAMRLRVPYVIAHADEALPHPLVFVRRPFTTPRLAYVTPRPGDRADNGVLRARILDNRQGAPLWRMLNTARQWRCMERVLCQVCGQEATDPETGRIPWVITATAFRAIRGVEGSGYTSAPATCRDCIPEALATCLQLRKSSAVATAARSEPAAILADIFRPGPGRTAIHTDRHNVFVGLDETALLRRVLATQLIVRLHDLQPAPRLVSRTG